MQTPEQWQDAATLADEYVQSLGISLDFQNWSAEREHLAAEYSAPDGRFLLARVDGALAGCGAIRRLSESACEIKRLYVRPSGRGRGTGRAIVEGLIRFARGRGYDAIFLDTLASMDQARRLYSALGFTETGPYRYNPLDGARFVKLELRASK